MAKATSRRPAYLVGLGPLSKIQPEQAGLVKALWRLAGWETDPDGQAEFIAGHGTFEQLLEGVAERAETFRKMVILWQIREARQRYLMKAAGMAPVVLDIKDDLVAKYDADLLCPQCMNELLAPMSVDGRGVPWRCPTCNAGWSPPVGVVSAA